MSEKKIVQVINKSNYDLPEYKTSGAAGFDFVANIEEPIILEPLKREIIHTGLYIKLPEGYELQVRPRSGLALKNGITVLNTPGCVDEDYIGEIGVILINLSSEPYTIQPGERIAQGILSPVQQIQWEEVTELPKTERGEGGFGSTGKN